MIEKCREVLSRRGVFPACLFYRMYRVNRTQLRTTVDS